MTFRQLEDLVLKLEREVHGNTKKQLLDEIARIYCRAASPNEDPPETLKRIVKICEVTMKEFGVMP